MILRQDNALVIICKGLSGDKIVTSQYVFRGNFMSSVHVALKSMYNRVVKD